MACLEPEGCQLSSRLSYFDQLVPNNADNTGALNLALTVYVLMSVQHNPWLYPCDVIPETVETLVHIILSVMDATGAIVGHKDVYRRK